MRPVGRPGFILILRQYPHLFRDLRGVTSRVLINHNFLTSMALTTAMRLRTNRRILIILIRLFFINVQQRTIRIRLTKLTSPRGVTIITIFLFDRRAHRFVSDQLVIRVRGWTP